MGQIIGGAAKPKRCNLNKLSQFGTPAAGEYILVSSDNSMNAAGQGNFDSYIEGDGTTAATALELKYIADDTATFNQAKNAGTASSYWYKSSGTIAYGSSGAGVHRVDFIPVIAGHPFSFYTDLGAANVAAALFADDSNNVISIIAKTDATSASPYTGNVPTGATRIYVNYKTSFELKLYGMSKRVDMLEEECVAMQNKLKNYTEGYYLDTYGALVQNPAYDISDFIPYNAGEEIVWWWSDTMTNADSIIKICGFDNEKQFVSGAYASALSGTIQNGKIVDASGWGAKIAYLRASYVHGSTLAKVKIGGRVWAKSDNTAEGLDILKYDVENLGGAIISASSQNLFEPDNCEDNKNISDSTGDVVNADVYWVSGLIPVDTARDTNLVLSSPFVYRIGVYDSAKTKLHVYTTQNDRSNPIDITGASYVRFSFSKDKVSFDERYLCRVYYANEYSVDAHKILPKDVSFKDTQFVSLADAIGFASDRAACAFTSSFKLRIYKGTLGSMPIIFSAIAKYENNTDDAVPTIRFIYGARQVTAFSSCYYTIGAKEDYRQNEWRIPPFFLNSDIVDVEVTIPENVTLYIKEISNRYSDAVNRNVTGMRFNSHLSYGGSMSIQFCSLEAFEMAAKMGFPSVVAVPKRASDGVWVCYHDDGAVGTTLNRQGVALSSEEQAKTINQFSSSEIAGMNYRIDNLGIYRKIPTLAKFFAVCSKTGMMPMLSVHPYPSASEWQEIKSLANKYGVLGSICIKAGSIYALEAAKAVFGDNVESYILYCTVASTADNAVTNMDSIFENDKGKVRLVIELSGDLATETRFSAILAGGYSASVYNSQTSAEQVTKWMDMGVSEFTEDYNTSFGLNW